MTAHEGTLEHFAGDGLMVFFNDPVPLPDPELQAAKLALAMRARIGECAAGWRRLTLRSRDESKRSRSPGSS